MLRDLTSARASLFRPAENCGVLFQREALVSDPVVVPLTKVSWLAGFSVFADMVGLDPLALVWGAFGGFVLQSYRKSEEKTVFVISKVASASFVSAAFATPIALWLISKGVFDIESLKSVIIGVAFLCGGAAQGLFLALVDGIPALVRSQVDRWKRGGTNE